MANLIQQFNDLREDLEQLIRTYQSFLLLAREWNQFGRNPGELNAVNIAGFWVPFNLFSDLLEEFEPYVRRQLLIARGILMEINLCLANLDPIFAIWNYL